MNLLIIALTKSDEISVIEASNIDKSCYFLEIKYYLKTR